MLNFSFSASVEKNQDFPFLTCEFGPLFWITILSRTVCMYIFLHNVSHLQIFVLGFITKFVVWTRYLCLIFKKWLISFIKGIEKAFLLCALAEFRSSWERPGVFWKGNRQLYSFFFFFQFHNDWVFSY